MYDLLFRIMWSWNRDCHVKLILFMVACFFTPVLYPRIIDAKFCDCGPNLFWGWSFGWSFCRDATFCVSTINESAWVWVFCVSTYFNIPRRKILRLYTRIQSFFIISVIIPFCRIVYDVFLNGNGWFIVSYNRVVKPRLPCEINMIHGCVFFYPGFIPPYYRRQMLRLRPKFIFVLVVRLVVL